MLIIFVKTTLKLINIQDKPPNNKILIKFLMFVFCLGFVFGVVNIQILFPIIEALSNLQNPL
jgi:hypothetical protein